MSARQDRPKRKAAAAALEAITGVRRRKMDTSFEFSGVSLSADVMVNIMRFLPKPELVHHASLVNSSWRAVSENPVLWTTLYQNIWKKPTKANGGTMTSMKRFLELLRRPQFRRLNILRPPHFIRRTKSGSFWKEMGKACPYLEELEIGFFGFIPHGNAELLLLPECFPNLKLIDVVIDRRIGLITHDGVAKFLLRLGESLESLYVGGIQNFSSQTLGVLGRACPNLKSFSYVDYGEAEMSSEAMINLIKTCTKLEDFQVALPEADAASVEVLNGIRKFENNHGKEYPKLDLILYAHDKVVRHIV